LAIETEKKLIKMLVAIAWADGRVAPEEMEIVGAVVEGFGLDEADAKEMLEWAVTPRTLDDIDVSGLTEDDLALVLHQAVLLTYVDGEQSDKEVALIKALVEKIGMDKARADEVLAGAAARAKALLPELGA
jgi:uncharacterized tellurite resistance protein B-like protein